MSPTEELQNRYVELANAIAVLVVESDALEIAMHEEKCFPMSIQVGNHLRQAHESILHPCLSTLSKINGTEIEIV